MKVGDKVMISPEVTNKNDWEEGKMENLIMVLIGKLSKHW